MELDPASLTLDEMLRMDAHALHQLARKSAGTVTRYRVLLGRLLLAIGRTDAYLEHGCSSAVHYGILQLGLPPKEARRLICIARELESLPYLRQSANQGQIEWSKLREVVRVATPETEREWGRLCRVRTYAEIENLVARSERGEIPADQPTRSGPRSELRCHFEPDQMAVLERGLQLMCQLAGRALSMAEAIELLFAEKLAEHAVDEQQLEQVRLEATRDLGWSDVINAGTESCPGQAEIAIVNPKSRVPTKAQRRKILRRDGHQCAVPGCENSLWLDTHHIIYYAQGGLTVPENMITLCTKCHRNVHENRLQIVGSASRGLLFLNGKGRDIRQERTLDIAFWLDIWCGWLGHAEERRYQGALPAIAVAEDLCTAA
ncbi:MAG: HNH endonuclease [Candidatus Eremiobacteraeota bacterium]|nr:HNH endonuclease [Candidatus Eremiobacteraeota bacterium]MCW5872596.1 HNH endonuclease [Candidatus Eremiobacteraeota bacterium]